MYRNTRRLLSISVRAQTYRRPLVSLIEIYSPSKRVRPCRDCFGKPRTCVCITWPPASDRSLTVDCRPTDHDLGFSEIIGFNYVPLDKVTPMFGEIVKAVEEKIASVADSCPPGLMEQYKILLRRMKHGLPCEIISIGSARSLISMIVPSCRMRLFILILICHR